VGKHLLICCIYRPPHDTKFFELFNISLEKALDDNLEVLIMGDLNCDFLANTGNSNELKFLCDLHGLANIVQLPTRVTETSATLINVIIISNTAKYTAGGVYSNCLSDHHMVYTNRGCKRVKPKPQIISTRIFKNMGELSFLVDLASTPWLTIDIFDSVHDK